MKTRNSQVIDIALAVCGAIITLMSSLSALTILTERAAWIPVTFTIVAGVTGAIQMALRDYAQATTVPAKDVLEARSADGREVVAGPAADMVDPGTVVREYGSDVVGKYAYIDESPVTADSIATGAITGEKIATGTITTRTIAVGEPNPGLGILDPDNASDDPDRP